MARLIRRSLVFLFPLVIFGCGSISTVSPDASAERPERGDGAASDAPAVDVKADGADDDAPSDASRGDGAVTDGGASDGAVAEHGADGLSTTADAGTDAAADAVLEAAPTDAGSDVATCPADKPVRDNGLCCPTGRRNCGGTCVACAAGSVCSGSVCGCPSTSQCAPAVPSGWLGPVAADLSGQNTACVAAYPTSISAGTNPKAAPAACNCTCGACSGGSCEAFADGYSGGACSGTASMTLDIGGSINQCTDSVPNGSLYMIRGVADKAGSSCASTRNSVSAPEPTWTTSTRLCTGAVVTPGACAGGDICAPLTAPQKTCIYRAGSMTCPTGYPASSTQYLAFADTRDCACACNPSSATCAPQVSFISTAGGCTGDTGFPFTQCGSVFAGSTHGFRIDSLNVTVKGTFSFTSSGGVTPASPITVCCTN